MNERTAVLVLRSSSPGGVFGGLDTYFEQIRQTVSIQTTYLAHFHTIPPDFRYLSRSGFDPQLAALIRNANVVHANDYFAGYAALIRAAEGKLITAFHLLHQAYSYYHRSAPQNADVARYERDVIVRSDRLVAVSHAMRRHLEALGARPDRIKVIPNGVHPRFFNASRSRQPGPLRILFSGRLVEQKGADLIERLLRQLGDVDFEWRLDIAGEGPGAKVIRQAIRQFEFTDRCCFHGWVPHDQLPDLYANADVTLSLSRYEPFGLFALESIAAGTPVIGRIVDGLREFCFDGKNAITVPDGARFLERLVGDLREFARYRTDRFDRRSVRDTVRLLTWEATGMGLCEVYQGMPEIQ